MTSLPRATLSTVLVAVATMLSITSSALAAQVEFTLEACGTLASLSAPAQVAILPLGDHEELETEIVSRSVALPDGVTTFELELPAATSRVALESPDFWAEPLVVEKGVKRVRVEVWPRSNLTGALRVPRGEVRPRAFQLRLRRSERSASASARRRSGACELPETLVDTCGVEEEGAFRCGLPAGHWNITLKADGWAARHFWARNLSARQAESIGDVSLRRGASLLGQVTTVDGPANPAITRVWAVPVKEGQVRIEPAELAKRGTDPSAELNDQGYFVFEDLTPGRYVLIVHQPGFAVHDRVQVTVAENRETALRDPIVLTPPLRLRVLVEPPVDPFDAPWEVRLYRESALGEALDTVDRGGTEEGRWRADSLQAGAYHLAVFDSRRNRWLSEGPLHLEDEDGAEVFLPLTVDRIEVEGSVRLGEDPLADVEIWFGGHDGEVSIESTTDDDGHYDVFLPRAGEWEVDLAARRPPIRHSGTVEVPERGGRVDVELPDTRLAGRVVTEDGGVPDPLPNAGAVRTDADVGIVALKVEEDGTFEVRGIEEGVYAVQAESEHAATELVTVTISEEVNSPELTLVLRSAMTVDGMVVTEHGGLAGARVEAVPLSASGQLLQAAVPSTQSGPSGAFQLRLPASTSTVLLTLFPPGFALIVERRSINDLRIQVSAPEATLRLATADGSDGGMVPVVIADGDLIPVPVLARWAMMNGLEPEPDDEQLVVPAVASGVYRYCLVALTELQALMEGSSAPTRCTEGVANPGGELTLSVP